MKTLIATVVSAALVLPTLAQSITIPSPARVPALEAYGPDCSEREAVVYFAAGETELSDTARDALAASVQPETGCEIRKISLTASAAEGVDVAFARQSAVDEALAKKRLSGSRRRGETAILAADTEAARLPSGRAVSLKIIMETARAS